MGEKVRVNAFTRIADGDLGTRSNALQSDVYWSADIGELDCV
jgi:hypothetical protein